MTYTERNNMGAEPIHIVYFDGVCGMCNAAVDFIMKRDNRQLFFFSPLQGETARKQIGLKELEKLDTVYYQKGDQLYTKSSAALQIAWTLGGAYRLCMIAWIIPPFLRNLIYDFIAARRYKWFGKKEECRIPSPDERKRFLP
ncbi:MAG: DCC1-like thiol-disulfide oxidoreductase family protein [Cytophagaceae bacterium]|jgi:predicted DCC family thiol-disulfide oxidoreductase YuxK|nr:DCC1-like thiol-disulfide oxidoreductase family protein [Cytophagaceae bacterium]